MEIRKMLLYLAVALIGTVLWVTWQKDYPPAESADVMSSQSPAASGRASEPASAEDFVPSTYVEKQPSTTDAVSSQMERPPSAADSSQPGVVTVKTDKVLFTISALNGDVVGADLLDYPASLKEKDQPVQILSGDPDRLYVAQGGLTNIDSKSLLFRSDRQHYTLQPGQNSLNVVLRATTSSGLVITKTYIFSRDRYAVDARVHVANQGQKIWRGSFYNQLIRKNTAEHGMFSRSYTGAAVSTPQTPYQKLSFQHMSEHNLSQNITGGWIAMQEPYFLSAWVPDVQRDNHYYSQSFGSGDKGRGNTFILGYVSPEMSLSPGQSAQDQSTLYVGPEIATRLKAIAHGLELTIDYGWLWFLAQPIFLLMSFIHSLVHNWGWAIILITLLIKLIFYPLSNKAYKSMVRMREVTPRLQALRERYADDKQALGKATMEFYKKEKINPAGGCLPMLIQIPVFIALYYVLIESVELRQAHFLFWIRDLSSKDAYYVLPILMGLSMLLQQKLSPPPPDPMQAKMMMLLPIVFTIFFLSFPAGLVLYWLTNNCLSISQQWYVMKTYDPNKSVRRKKKR